MAADSTEVLQAGFRRSGWSATDLWLAAAGIGGALHPGDVRDITDGRRSATPGEHDILAAALNDHFIDAGQDRPVAPWELVAHR